MRPLAVLYMRKHELVVFLGKLLGHGIPYHADFFNFIYRSMLRKIVRVVCKNFILDFSHGFKISGGCVLIHRFGHSAYNKVFLQQAFHGFCIDFGNCPISGPFCKKFNISFFATGGQKFPEVHREHLHAVDFPDREGNVFATESNAEQRPRTRHMEFTLVFAKIFQGSNCPRSFLDFIKNQESLAGLNFALRKQLKLPDNPLYIKVIIENGSELVARLKVDVAYVIEVFCAEFL